MRTLRHLAIQRLFIQHPAVRFFVVVWLLLIPPRLLAEEIEIDTEDSILAVITHKSGFAAKRAHNHLIVVASDSATLSFDAAAPLSTRFELDFAADQLSVDPWAEQQAWYPRLEGLGILSEPFGEIADKDRRKIRASMLGGKQLDATRFPRISAAVTSVADRPMTLGGVDFPYTAELVLEVRGQSVEKPVAARFESTDGSLVIEAVGTFRFTDFGIEPFSAFLGAVKNDDEFHVYLHLSATTK